MHNEIQYSVCGSLQQEELGKLLLSAANSCYSANELESIISKSTAYITARDSENLVGFGRLLSDGAVLAYINNIAVSPEYQKQGIGKAMLDRLIETVGRVKSIFLYSNTADLFYLHNGFQLSEKRLYMRRRREINQ
jgi:ribosomal protein S18 acetylase RimI-like enzyme